MRSSRGRLARVAALLAAALAFHGAVAAIDIDTLWEYGDPAASEARFRAQLPSARGDDRLELLPSRARALFLDAWHAARKAGAEGLAVDAAHMVAITASGTAEALEWNRRGLALARGSRRDQRGRTPLNPAQGSARSVAAVNHTRSKRPGCVCG
jgi:hypothetical protein